MMSPCTGRAPAAASSSAEAPERVRARTGRPDAIRRRSTAWPTKPLAPVMRVVASLTPET